MVHGDKHIYYVDVLMSKVNVVVQIATHPYRS
jgi:hypothetical protein